LPACPSDQSKSYDNCFGTYAWPMAMNTSVNPKMTKSTGQD